MSEHEDLLERLRALLDEARERGIEDELVVSVHAWKSAKPVSVVAPELPGRFGIVGESPQMAALFDRMERVAPAKAHWRPQ